MTGESSSRFGAENECGGSDQPEDSGNSDNDHDHSDPNSDVDYRDGYRGYIVGALLFLYEYNIIHKSEYLTL